MKYRVTVCTFGETEAKIYIHEMVNRNVVGGAFTVESVSVAFVTEFDSSNSSVADFKYATCRIYPCNVAQYVGCTKGS